MRFVSSIIVVEDVPRSRILYENILLQKVVADFGVYNVAFEGGFSLYQKALFQKLTGGLAIARRSNTFVLYFEVDNIARAEQAIASHGLEFVHNSREQPWMQRTFRCYDYDGHILEVAEEMTVVTGRLHREKRTIEEIARLTGLPAEQVREHLDADKGRR